MIFARPEALCEAGPAKGRAIMVFARPEAPRGTGPARRVSGVPGGPTSELILLMTKGTFAPAQSARGQDCPAILGRS